MTTRDERATPKRKGRRIWTHLFVAFAAVIIAAWYRYPQPNLDEDPIKRLAAGHVGNGGPVLGERFQKKEGPLHKTVIAVTGATSGIGLELATKLHGWGGTVLAIGRSPSKLERLRTALDGEGGGGAVGANVTRRLVPFVADLNDLASVARAADEIGTQFRKIDFLVNNAGMHYGGLEFFRSRSTVQGLDVAFGVNYLSHFLLTEKLLPLLQKSNRNPRIIQVSSSFHWLSGGDDLLPERDGTPFAARPSSDFSHGLRSYPNSKLAQILHARALSRKLAAAPSHIKVVSACPGWVSTPIGGSFNHRIMSHLAFPPNGFGLSSILYAMFQPLAGIEGKDWVVNSKLFHDFGELFTELGFNASWTSATKFRDGLVWVVAVGALYLQKLFAEVIWTTSSPESYNVTLQDSLEGWSRDAVSDWL